MSTRSYVRDVSPYFQQLLVKLMEEAYRARMRGNTAAYETVLAHMYDSLPGHVREEVVKELSERLGQRVGDLEDVLVYAEGECERIRSQYGKPLREKMEQCNALKLSILNALYSVITLKIHEKGLLSVTKIVQVGEL